MSIIKIYIDVLCRYKYNVVIKSFLLLVLLLVSTINFKRSLLYKNYIFHKPY